MGKRLVCLCNFVEEKEITALLNRGILSVAEIQNRTRAGTTCGRCLPEIDALIKACKKNKPKDPQKRLDFGF